MKDHHLYGFQRLKLNLIILEYFFFLHEIGFIAMFLFDLIPILNVFF